MVQQTVAEKPALRLVRRFDAAPEHVWNAWTEPEALKRWFGPDAGAVSLAQTDVRVGGRFHVVFRTLDGEQHDVSGTYREVQPFRRLVFTWAWISTPERVSQVSLSFVPSDGGTEFTLLHEQFFDMAARDGHQRGWSGSLDKLAHFLQAHWLRGGDLMAYVDGFIVPVPKKQLKAYAAIARKAGKVWREHGALEYREWVADDVKPGKWTSFPQSVKLKPDEIVVFSWIVYKSRAQRDRVMAKVMKDKRLAPMMQPGAMPFDGRRMIWGGFKPLVSL